MECSRLEAAIVRRLSDNVVTSICLVSDLSVYSKEALFSDSAVPKLRFVAMAFKIGTAVDALASVTASSESTATLIHVMFSAADWVYGSTATEWLLYCVKAPNASATLTEILCVVLADAHGGNRACVVLLAWLALSATTCPDANSTVKVYVSGISSSCHPDASIVKVSTSEVPVRGSTESDPLAGGELVAKVISAEPETSEVAVSRTKYDAPGCKTSAAMTRLKPSVVELTIPGCVKSMGSADDAVCRSHRLHSSMIGCVASTITAAPWISKGVLGLTLEGSALRLYTDTAGGYNPQSPHGMQAPWAEAFANPALHVQLVALVVLFGCELAGQTAQASIGEELNWFTHATHDVLPGSVKVFVAAPAQQERQLVLPCSGWYCPGTHAVQAVWAVVALYPAKHGWQSVAPANPAVQEQA